MTNKTLQSNKVDRDSTQLINFNQRRITNAAPAVNAGDYITLQQTKDLITQAIPVTTAAPNLNNKKFITAIFPSIVSGQDTNHAYLRVAYNNILGKINAVSAPSLGSVSINFQTASDDSSWITRCTLTLAQNLNFAVDVSVSVAIPANVWHRCVVAGGSDQTAKMVTAQFQLA